MIKLLIMAMVVVVAIAPLTFAQSQHGITLAIGAAGTGSTSTCFYSGTVKGGPYAKLGCQTALTYFVPVTNANSGIQTYFVATGLNSIGESGYSNEVVATFPVLPQPPTGLSAQSQ